MDWKNVVGKVAPMLGAALGGPLGGAAVGVIAEALGLNEQSEAAIKAALSGTTPEQMLALKNADQVFTVKMRELGFQNERDMEGLAVSDRDSARKREMAVGDHTTRNLAYAITVGFFSVLGCLMFGEVDAESKDVLLIMLGSLGSAWAGVIAYYFGSTATSKQKNELLARTKNVEEGGVPPNPFVK